MQKVRVHRECDVFAECDWRKGTHRTDWALKVAQTLKSMRRVW